MAHSTPAPVGLGYDAGGNHRHGVALVAGDPPRLVRADCLATAANVVAWLEEALHPSNEQAPSGPDASRALGIDTLMAWSLGPSGDREAERILRLAYPKKRRSVMHPNSLFGAMPLSGMAVAMRVAAEHPALPMSEVHPGVLTRALQGTPAGDRLQHLHDAVDGLDLTWGQMAHARDATTCALAAWHVADGRWDRDLLAGDEWISPLPAPRFYWPHDPRIE